VIYGSECVVKKINFSPKPSGGGGVNKFVEIPVKFHLISISELVLVAARIWKWIYVQSFFRTTSLGFAIQSSLCLFLLGLLVVDAVTFYLEVRC
jgi:hypothetical protein